MSNINGFDNVNFAQLLLSNIIVKAGTEKYYVHWIRSFYNEKRWQVRF